MIKSNSELVIALKNLYNHIPKEERGVIDQKIKEGVINKPLYTKSVEDVRTAIELMELILGIVRRTCEENSLVMEIRRLEIILQLHRAFHAITAGSNH